MNLRSLMVLSMILVVAVYSSELISQTSRKKMGSQMAGGSAPTQVYENDFVDQQPEFPGGGNQMINFINATREYPQEAYEMGIEGRVTCAFIVSPDGKISHIKVLRGVEESLNHEAIRIISMMPDWIPGKIHDQAVPVRVVTCIPFRR